ncbi:MAG: hypothetical protein IKW64_00935 [Clostridia bacterium]|nr:hypothetical protein [Clostridia bacterium]
MGKMHINILHRIDTGDTECSVFEALVYQQDAVHKLGMRATLLLGTEALYSEACVEYALLQEKTHGDELGLNLHGLTANGLGERFGIKDSMVYLMPYERKIKLLFFVMELFKEKIGHYPKSVVSYVLDARTLNWLHQTYPTVKAAITNCFEEGVKMFYGNQNQWYLFSDGGPWGAYYPSKANSLVEAKDREDYCGIVGLPHLNRDMLMAITSRDDLFSSHPHNVMRAKAYDFDNMEMPYMDRFVDQWVKQLEYNDYIYYNVFVGPLWLTDESMLDESGAFARELYTQNMTYLKKKVDEGVAQISTMSEFAEWMEANVEIGTPEVNKWQDIICGSKREVYWYVDPYIRVALDANIAGAICDLRPHAGRLVRDLGNDTPNLCNMNYPFLISCEHRGGVHDGSIHTYRLEINGKETDLALKRTSISPGTDENGNKFVKFEPVTYTLDNIRATVESKYTFMGNGKIKISRKLVSCSNPNAVVKIKEYHCGCWGTTTYPEDMRGIDLIAYSNDGDEEKINFEYLGRELRTDTPKTMRALIPQLNITVDMEPITDGTEGKVTEGWMFSPYYRMQLTKELKESEALESWLKIRQAEY